MILVTTKKGTAGGGKVTYDVQFGTTTIGPHRAEMLNAQQYIAVENLAYDNIKVFDRLMGCRKLFQRGGSKSEKKKSPLLFDSMGIQYNTDWLKEATQSKLSQNHNVGFTGGNADATYGIFLGYRR